jgi:fibro-slime domain-containing protein
MGREEVWAASAMGTSQLSSRGALFLTGVILAVMGAGNAGCVGGQGEVVGATGGQGGTATSAGSGGGGGSTGPAVTIALPDAGRGGGAGPTPDAPPARVCGNGLRTLDEACDDGNTDKGDGCAADCLRVESGYSCPVPGHPCQRIARCGDGVATLPEACDDGNLKDGDGCSSTCRLETGYKCSGSPSACSQTVCGDGKLEGAESCDDGNTTPFDGCSSRCESEPDCGQGACESRCGDGILLGEACDDGNNVSGDGCSADCKIEAGYTCTQQAAECQKVGGKCVTRADAIFRDFTGETTGEHPDFIGCDVLPVTLGMVEKHLDAEGKPVRAATSPAQTCNGTQAMLASQASFGQWYRNSAASAEVAGSITLFDNGQGGFVNRHGPNGEQWTDADGKTYDGSPLFFPLDGKGKQDPGYSPMDKPATACINSKYGKAPASYTSVPHNFHFTTEITNWFKYDAATTNATLAFTGDDDVWVFLNGTLAVDLGGVHHPADGSVTIHAATAAQYGLEDGKVYAIKVFQAERRICGSTFRLTLTGFSTSRSLCKATCGDGVVGLGEECDDGVNDGGYGECGPGCKLTSYCGDGVVQLGEDCDDGNNLDGDDCPSSCHNLIIY